MKRITGALLLAAAMVLPLAACSPHPVPSADAVSKWASDDANAAAFPVGVDTIGIGGSIADPDTRDVPGEGVSFGQGESPVTVTGFQVKCYGADRMAVQYTVDTATDTTSIQSDPVICDKKPHTIPFHAKNVTKITVDGLRTPSPTGWFITALGYATPTDAQIAAWVKSATAKLKSGNPSHTVMGGLLDAQPSAPSGGSSLSKDFRPPITVEAVWVTCYGAPTMRVHVQTSGPTHDGVTEMSETTTPQIPCDKKPHKVALGIKNVATVEITGRSARINTSYLVFVTGS